MAMRAGRRRSWTTGMERQQFMGKQFWVQVQELSMARGGCSTGISA
jgi:hypothetical protein